MPTHKLVAHEVAVEAAATILPLLETVPRTCGEAPACQRHAGRAPPRGGEADEIGADRPGPALRGLGAAQPRRGRGPGPGGRDRLHHYRIAYGSARETATALRLLVRLALVERQAGTAGLELVDRTCALTWRLIEAGRRA